MKLGEDAWPFGPFPTFLILLTVYTEVSVIGLFIRSFDENRMPTDKMRPRVSRINGEK